MKSFLVSVVILSVSAIFGSEISWAQVNGGVGHPFKLIRSVETVVPDKFTSSLFLQLDGKFSNKVKRIKTHDFTGDGIRDDVWCYIKSEVDIGVQIYDGTTGKLFFTHWVTPHKDSRGHRRTFQDCSVANIKPGRAAIFMAAGRNTAQSVRGMDFQYFYYRSDTGKMVLDIVEKPDGVNFRAAGRGISCKEYPQSLVSRGFNAGALCFYSAYDSSPSGLTHSALVKIEYVNGALNFKDLTQSAGLPWPGGMNGSWGGSNPAGDPDYAGSSNGHSMLAAAFIDYDRNGDPDFIVGGAHSDVELFRMDTEGNTGYYEGVKFKRSKLFWGEVNRLHAFNESVPGLNSTCVYVDMRITRDAYNTSSYYTSGKQAHIICHKNGGWASYNIPGANVFGEGNPVNMVMDNKSGRVYLHLGKNKNTGLPEFFYFDTKEVHPSTILATTVVPTL